MDKEIVLELDKLIKYAAEIELVTKYKGVDRPNFQKLRSWIVEKKGEI